MNYRNFRLTSLEEDFKKIGLIPPSRLDETDDPKKPREVSSPDPSTLSGLDDSEGEKSAKQPGAKQPKPKMGPPADDSEAMDPLEDGGSKGAQKGGKGPYVKVAGGKEASIKGESKHNGYTDAKNQPGLKAKGKNKGEKPQIAQGLKPTKKVAGMSAGGAKMEMESKGPLSRAVKLLSETEEIIQGIRTDEHTDEVKRSFRLVSENSALLADRLSEISSLFEVDEHIEEMEELSKDAAEAIDCIEMEIHSGGNDEDEAAAVANSGEAAGETIEDMDEADEKVKSDRKPDETYDVPSPAFKEEVESLLQAMVEKLMNVLEAYDGALDALDQNEDDAMPFESDGEHFDDDEKQVSPRHMKHQPSDDDQETGGHDGHEHHDSAHGQDDGDGHDDHDADNHGGEPDGDSDDGQAGHGDDMGGDLMARMRALRAKKDAMGGAHQEPPFRGAE